MQTGLYGLLALVAIAVEVVLVTVAFVFVRRVRNRPSTPVSEQIGVTKIVLDKVRKRQPMSPEELHLAHQIVKDRQSLLIFAIPAAIFTMGCFFVLGSLEQLHGATPSERTFLGVIPMCTSTSLALRLLSSARLKKLLRERAS